MFGPKSPYKKLMAAVRNGQADEVRRLIDEDGADVNGGNQRPPLYDAAYYGHIDCVRILLEKGAEVDGRMNASELTPLMMAASRGYLGIAKVLLEAGADLSLHGGGRTAVEWAQMANHIDMVALLEKPPAQKLPETPDQVMLEYAVGNRLVQEIFNFESMERIMLVRKDSESPVEAMTCKNFSELEDKSRLRKAFDEHVRRGGTVPEERIFPAKTPRHPFEN